MFDIINNKKTFYKKNIFAIIFAIIARVKIIKADLLHGSLISCFDVLRFMPKN